MVMSSQGPSQSQQYNWLDKSWGGAVQRDVKWCVKWCVRECVRWYVTMMC